MASLNFLYEGITPENTLITVYRQDGVSQIINAFNSIDVNKESDKSTIARSADGSGAVQYQEGSTAIDRVTVTLAFVTPDIADFIKESYLTRSNVTVILTRKFQTQGSAVIFSLFGVIEDGFVMGEVGSDKSTESTLVFNGLISNDYDLGQVGKPSTVGLND